MGGEGGAGTNPNPGPEGHGKPERGICYRSLEKGKKDSGWLSGERTLRGGGTVNMEIKEKRPPGPGGGGGKKRLTFPEKGGVWHWCSNKTKGKHRTPVRKSRNKKGLIWDKEGLLGKKLG